MTTLQTHQTRMRDPRLDFFRGLGMFIIFMAHMPQNFWSDYLPGRFGFSDSTEIFVFCSGIACALAFGKIFKDKGWLLGTARVVYRLWQIYWVHIGLFLSLTVLMIWMDGLHLINKDHVKSLNLHVFLQPDLPHTLLQNLLALMTLTYVPNYFDILPMYIVILMLIPAVMALQRFFGTGMALAAIGFLWLASQWNISALTWLHLPAEPWSDRSWYFNPFAWQLVFFTGFAFTVGWIKLPPANKYLIGLAAGIVVLTLPFAWHVLVDALPFAQKTRAVIDPYIQKTNLGVLRFVHFLALAYLAWIMAGPNGIRLRPQGFMKHAVRVIHKVGQQALATFVTGMIIAQPLGTFLDIFERNFATLAIANICGIMIMIAVAYSVGWFKSAPWKTGAETKLTQDNARESHLGSGLRNNVYQVAPKKPAPKFEIAQHIEIAQNEEENLEYIPRRRLNR